MQIAVFGIKDNLSFQEELLKKIYPKILCSFAKFSLIPLITCHRFEIYFTYSEREAMQNAITSFLQNDLPDFMRPHVYVYFDKACFMHLCKTTAGLDSAILGESEIQRQVKEAYHSFFSKELTFSMHFLFQKALKVGKLIRTQFTFPKKSIKLNSFIFDNILKDFQKPKILFVGNSEINRNIQSFFQAKKMDSFTYASRFYHSEQMLPWSRLDLWSQFDVVICGSKYGKKCIFPQEIEKKILIFDLSVPRIVDPKIGEMVNTKYWSLDQIHKSFHLQSKNFQKDVVKCLKMIEEQVDRFFQIYEKKERLKLAAQKKAC